MLGKKIPSGVGGGPGTTGRSLQDAAFKASIQLLPNLKELQLLQYLMGLCRIQHVLGAGCVGFPERGAAGLGRGEDVRAKGRGWSCCPGRHRADPSAGLFPPGHSCISSPLWTDVPGNRLFVTHRLIPPSPPLTVRERLSSHP